MKDLLSLTDLVVLLREGSVGCQDGVVVILEEEDLLKRVGLGVL